MSSSFRNKSQSISLVLCCVALLAVPPWGFFGHRLINRQAVFTLPVPLIGFFKAHIDYLTEHAVDPDMRRHASPHEAVRHYIDLDHFGTWPFASVPRRRIDALFKFSSWEGRLPHGDTLVFVPSETFEPAQDSFLLRLPDRTFVVLAQKAWRDRFVAWILPQYYEARWVVPADSMNAFLAAQGVPLVLAEVWVTDHLTPFGILPWALEDTYRKLVAAFAQKDEARILRYASDIGHYLADACVPLHTTENYDGQLTDQRGIHAFWESRLPELFAEQSFDFFTGQASLVADPLDYFWSLVLDSHRLVEEVLVQERRVRDSLPPQQVWCTELRNGQPVQVRCRAFAQAYHEALGGMVERQMRRAVKAVGDIWYTAWLEAGQPQLSWEVSKVALPRLDTLMPLRTHRLRRQ